ncbi:MAG: hypothetical protein EXR07_04830 [Acetobacteraceae bacterium]|nr:hypothetical protein [Acetobacteraceae bacterium]
MRLLTQALLVLTAVLTQQGPAAAQPVQTASCAACAFVAARSSPGEEAVARALCARTLGVLDALGRWRDSFLAAPHYTELFSVIYWHITRSEMQAIAEGRYAHPLEILRQIDAFFDAYAWNRTRFEAGLSPEPHWLAHFSATAEADRAFGQVGRGMAFDTPDMVQQVIALGMVAHIEFDLPRSLRHAFTARRDPGVTVERMAADFRAADEIFAIAIAAMAADINTAVSATSDWDPALLRPEVMRWFGDILARQRTEALRLRHGAWAAAVGNAPLPTGNAPHPPPGPRPPVDCQGDAAHD